MQKRKPGQPHKGWKDSARAAKATNILNRSSQIGNVVMTLKEWIVDELESAEAEAQESHRIAMNSYGAGYDAGYVSAFNVVLSKLSQIAAGDEILDN